MAEYANQFNVLASEMLRLTFNDIKVEGAEPTKVGEVIMHFETAKILSDVLAKVLNEHFEKMEKIKQSNETNKTLS